MKKERINELSKSLLFGVAIGDALGVPFEFSDREEMQTNPAVDMVGYGTYNLPPGTFSDDASMTFCLAEALTLGFDLDIIASNFVKWRYDNYWTARGYVFDVGIATQWAIDRISTGIRPDVSGGFEEMSNGNGSLMRISPLVFYLMDKPIDERWRITTQVSSITHAHIRSVIACFYYLEFARGIIRGIDKFKIYEDLQQIGEYIHVNQNVNPSEVAMFDRLLKCNIWEFNRDVIYSSGYVLHTLEASIWCLLTTDNFKDAVLTAINLGEDTDTTAAVTGALSGLLCGFDAIPVEWIEQIARRDDIEDLSVRLTKHIPCWPYRIQ